MKLAFLYSAYTDPQQLKRLIDSLPEGSHHFIHVDAKSDIGPFRALLASPSVHFLEQRHAVVWGSFRQLEYQMSLFRAAILSGTDFDYLVTMSGMEYPVWSNSRIEQFFEEKKRRNEQPIQALLLTTQNHRQQRLYTRHWPFNNVYLRPGSLRSKLRVALRQGGYILGRRKKLEFDADGHHYRLHKGSDWFALSAEAARFVLDRWDNSPELQNYFRDSFTPSETAIHTILFCDERFRPSCMYVEGDYTRLADLTPLCYIDYRPLVRVLDESYYDILLQTDKMFCRKIRSGKSDRLVSLLESHRREG